MYISSKLHYDDRNLPHWFNDFLRQENSFVIKRDVNNGDIIMHLKYFVAILVS